MVVEEDEEIVEEISEEMKFKKDEILAIEDDHDDSQFWLAKFVKETEFGIIVKYFGTNRRNLKKAKFKLLYIQNQNGKSFLNYKKGKGKEYSGEVFTKDNPGMVLKKDISIGKDGKLSKRSRKWFEQRNYKPYLQPAYSD